MPEKVGECETGAILSSEPGNVHDLGSKRFNIQGFVLN